MSASFCVKCEKMVSGYEKYCPDCLDNYGVKQDVQYWKTRGFDAWQNREAEFQSDLSAVPADYRKPSTPSRHYRHVEFLKQNAITKPVYSMRLKQNKQRTQPGYMKRFGSRPAKHA